MTSMGNGFGLRHPPSSIKDPQQRLAMQQIIDIIRRLTTGENRAVMLSDMRRAGMVGDGGAVVPPGTVIDGGSGGLYNPVNDFRPPAAPTGFDGAGAFNSVIVRWNQPISQNVAFTEVWRGDINDVGSAALVGTASGRVYVDTPGINSGGFYWVRHVNYQGIPGAWQAVGGSEFFTAEDPADIIGLLVGGISESELATELGSRIDLIDAPSTGLIERVTTAEGELDSHTSQLTALTATAGANTAALSAQSTVIAGLEASYVIKTDVNGYVSGFGLYNDGGSSSFLVNADTFAVGKMGETDAYPFIIGNVNGVPRIALNAATFIPDATITNAKIHTVAAEKLFVVSGTIADAVIGSGHINNAMIGAYIRSDNWDEYNHIGWQIDKTGNAEFNSIQVYDSMGELIFSSGAGVQWSKVAGAGKPADNADVTASSPQDPTWLTEPVIWSGNKISSGNISNYMDSLAVGTLYIGTEAVTVPVSSLASSGSSYIGGGTTVVNVPITISGLPGGQTAGVTAFGNVSVYPSVGGATGLTATLYINGVLCGFGASSTDGFGINLTAVGKAQLGNGTYNATFVVTASPAGTFAYDAGIAVIGSKR